MTPSEAATLLTMAAHFDNRKPDPDTAKAWAAALNDLRVEDCREAVVAHYRASREWLMPREVRAGVKRLRDQRLTDHGPVVPPPGLDPDDALGYARWLKGARQQIADGTYVEPERPAIAARPPVDYRAALRRPPADNEPAGPVCPECAAGKCQNCPATALDEATDEIVPCACDRRGHASKPGRAS